MHPPPPQVLGNQQPPPPPEAQAQLVLDIKRHWLVLLQSMITPVIVINGRPMTGRWGVNPIPLPPGRYHLHVYLPYFRTGFKIGRPLVTGQADLTVWLQPGVSLDVEYRAPMMIYSRGSLGPAPQRYNGMGCMVAVFVAMAAYLAFVVALIASDLF